MKRARLLVLASTVSMLGWGSVLPYQYAYAANTRGWGGLVAASAASLFSVGALVAAPVGGRLTDRFDPARVAVVAKVVSAVAVAFLIVAGTPALFLAGMFAFGAGITAGAPAQTVLVLRWVGSRDRRRVFALVFTGQAVGMAIGAFAAGYLIDLKQLDGMWPAFATAAIGFLLSAGLIGLAGRGAPADEVPEPEDAPSASVGSAVRVILATPTLRWTAVITVTLALGFYAQFESGLPAYAITVLGVSERTIGTAAAVNCLVVVVLQMAVVRWTAKRSASSLLVAVGSIWVLSWLLLAAASVVPELAGTMFVVVFGVFAVGETMYAPVLNPLTASLAPSGWSAPPSASSPPSRPVSLRRVRCWLGSPSARVAARCSSRCTWASASWRYSRPCGCGACCPARGRARRTAYRWSISQGLRWLMPLDALTAAYQIRQTVVSRPLRG